jgi:hypothetical protein
MDTRDVERLSELLEFERRMLEARIVMEGMLAENRQRSIEQKSMAYDAVAFNDLINQFHIGFNDYPYYRG